MAPPPPEIGREIRLALVLNGGVSLAVWMGGVTHEIDDLRRSSWQFSSEPLPPFSAAHEIYTGLLTALRAGLRVDIIAGSSAGGINGAALAAAIAARRPLRVDNKPLRDLWIRVGDMAQLLRSAGESNPRSLLKGDSFMLPQMRKAFGSILGSGPSPLPPVPTGDAPALQAALADERADATTVRLFVTTTAFTPNSREFKDALGTGFNVLDNRLRFRFIRDRWIGRDNFARGGSGAKLDPAQLMALAARATASFPVAFEPTKLDKEMVPSEILPIDNTTYAMDGGVLDNEPFDPALDQISQMPADELVTRYLVYIVPYSNRSSIQKDAAAEPTIRDVIGGVINLPRDVGIDLDMDRIINLGGLAKERDAANMALLEMTDAAALDALTAQLGYQYETSPTRVAESVAATSPVPGRAGGDETVYQRFAPPLTDAGKAAVAVPDPNLSFAAAERLALRAQAVLRKAFAGAADDTKEAIKEARAVVSVAATQIRLLSIESGEVVAGPALGELVATIIARLESTPGVPQPPERWEARLARVEVITQALPSSLARGIQPFEFVRLSSHCQNALAIVDLTSPDTKLAGLQLNHFGGFFKKSWRANDWTWGRLDGALQLIKLLLTLEGPRLQEAWDSPDFARALRGLAFPDGPQDVRDALLVLWNEKRALAKRPQAPQSWDEAVATFDADLVPGAAIPPQCIDAIAAHAQLRILQEEVPEIALQAEADRDDQWRQDTTTPDVPKDGPPLSAGESLAQFRDGWDGAEEKLGMEVSTPAFAKLSAQAAVVGSSALAGSRAGIPGAVRTPLVWLRGTTLGGFLFVRSWFAEPIAGLIVALLLISAAVLTVLISSALAVLTVPIAIGVTVAGSALVLGSGDKRRRAVCTGAAVATALVASLLLVQHTGVADLPTLLWVALGVVCILIGMAAGKLCEDKRPKLCLLVFLAALLVAAGALICLRSSGPLLDWIADAAKHRWPIGLLSLAVALPLAFGMRALAAAVSPDPEATRRS